MAAVDKIVNEFNVRQSRRDFLAAVSLLALMGADRDALRDHIGGEAFGFVEQALLFNGRIYILSVLKTPFLEVTPRRFRPIIGSSLCVGCVFFW